MLKYKSNLQLIIDKKPIDLTNFTFSVIVIVCRVFWLLLVLSAITLFSYILVSRCLHYFDYPSAVNVEILYPPSVPFPAITICNQNFMRYVTNKNEFYEYVKYYKNKIWQLSVITSLRWVSEKYLVCGNCNCKNSEFSEMHKCSWFVNSSKTQR